MGYSSVKLHGLTSSTICLPPLGVWIVDWLLIEGMRIRLLCAEVVTARQASFLDTAESMQAGRVSENKVAMNDLGQPRGIEGKFKVVDSKFHGLEVLGLDDNTITTWYHVSFSLSNLFPFIPEMDLSAADCSSSKRECHREKLVSTSM